MKQDFLKVSCDRCNKGSQYVSPTDYEYKWREVIEVTTKAVNPALQICPDCIKEVSKASDDIWWATQLDDGRLEDLARKR